MEFDIYDDALEGRIITNPPIIEGGVLHVPRPGWGGELDEKIIAAHPPK